MRNRQKCRLRIKRNRELIIMAKKFEKTWESIDSRPVPSWFDEAKFGIFIHWGIYSVPAYAPKRNTVESTGLAYAEWYGWQQHQKYAPYYDFHKRVYGEDFQYEDFVTQWKAEMFDAKKWAQLFKKAGAKYVTLVSKHHDAFCLWPSYYSWNWNSVELGPHRNIVKEVLEACDEVGITRGLYYSLLEWTHPVLRRPDPQNADIARYAVEKMIPQMKELIEEYKPKVLFTDGEWSYPSEKWHSLDFLTWLFNESSVKNDIVINDRWGSDTRCRHGGYFGTEYGEVNSGAQSEEESLALLTSRKWEENRSIGASFGYNRNEDIEDYLSQRQVIELLCDIVAKGGNLCLNVGPCADGTIAPVIQERLLQLGTWLDVNGECIYSSRPVRVEGLPEYALATSRGKNIYILCKKYPKEELCIKNAGITGNSRVSLLGSNAKVAYGASAGCVHFKAPALYADEMPCDCVQVFKIEN